ncbi:MAG: S8 family serine peptidase [Porphyrobacter sp.]|nr:S8 family serine peptidase [Porphyrobacter sp.]
MPSTLPASSRRAAALASLPLAALSLAALLPAPAAAQSDTALPAAGADEAAAGEAQLAVIATRPVAPMGGPAVPQSGGLIRAFRDGVDPLSGGLIRAFSGDISPFLGRIRTFEGEVEPSSGGLIRAFEGDIDPYSGGLIRAFWGDLTPEGGELSPQVGLIRAFSDAFVPTSRATLDIWSASEASGDYAPLIAQLRQIGQDGAVMWGPAVVEQTGKSFAAGFAEPFLAKWDVDLGDPQTLAGWSAFDRQRMMLDWYDNVLLFSGMDRVDHWMNAISWTPALTQVPSAAAGRPGSGAVVGLVDFFAAEDADVQSKVVFSGGYQDVNNLHGAGVGSLIVASHDGRGVMGVAPNAAIAAYNPFDQSMTASWDDVRSGVIAVGRAGASVINLSLGVPGSTLPAEWRDVFTAPQVNSFKNKAIYVIAAGNDGIAQTADVEMRGAFDNTFLVVGSVDPDGRISAFSNMPGTACLTAGGTCRNDAVWGESDPRFADSGQHLKSSGLLMNRFLVAPGEMILASDGQGGVTRLSGTSFATPLVSGTIALVHDRWPWLKRHPVDVARVILESAQDLGAPGVDPVYGHGLLNVAGALSALDQDRLTYRVAAGSGTRPISIAQLRSGGLPSLWSAAGAHIIAFETLDESYRDFVVPLSSRLFRAGGGAGEFEQLLYRRLSSWLGQASFADRGAAPVSTLANGWTMALRGRTEPVARLDGADRTRLLASVELSHPQHRLAFSFGSGDGAAALGGSGGLALSGDFDPRSGGANPLLGFASGAAHVAARVGLADALDLSFGVTRQDRSIAQDLATGSFAASDRLLLNSAGDYEAEAMLARLDWRPADRVTLGVSYTRLAERGAFLGTRSLERSDFGTATVSDGLSVAADAAIGNGFSLFASGTMSVSHSQGDAAFNVEGAVGTAFQAGFAKRGLLGGDQLRVTLAQPLTVERGHLDMQMVGVIDRETGETGLVTQRVAIGAPEQRRYRMEAFYGADMLEGAGRLGLFGSAELRRTDAQEPAFTAGGHVMLAF